MLQEEEWTQDDFPEMLPGMRLAPLRNRETNSILTPEQTPATSPNFREREYQTHLRIYFPHRHFHEHYQWLLEVSQSREATVQLQAGWATRSWTEVLSKVFSDLNSSECINALGLKEAPNNPELASRQADDVLLWFSLTLRSAAQRAWSMLGEYDTAPGNWSGILHSDEDIAAKAFARCKEDQDAVAAAFAVANDPGHQQHEAFNARYAVV